MSEASVKVLVFSDDVDKRRAVIEGVGASLGSGAPSIEWLEAATAQGAVDSFDENHPDLLIFDGETTKEGGMSVARRLEGLNDEMPPVIILVARQQDDWLAQWAGAAATVALPIDPLEIQETVLRVLTGRH